MNYSLRIEVDNSKPYVDNNKEIIEVLGYSEFSIIATNESDKYCHCRLYYDNILINDTMTTILPHDKLQIFAHNGSKLSFEYCKQDNSCIISGIFSSLYCDETTKNSDVKLSILVNTI